MKQVQSVPLSMVVSIVSHGHGDWVSSLLRQIRDESDPCVQRVVITLNIPEPELERQLQAQGLLVGGHFGVEVVRNPTPKGFGANHNAALANAAEAVVCILNPDITLIVPDTFAQLCCAVEPSEVGLAYPILRDDTGALQDNERSLPTLKRLIQRRMGGSSEAMVDWVSGACMVIKTRDWEKLRGFDERFFLYCEDVDLSLRVRQKIGVLRRAPVAVQHQGQRASRRKFKFMLWHIRSLLLLWSLPSYRWGCKNFSRVKRVTDPAHP